MASVNDIPQELLDHIIDFVDEPDTTSRISHLWLRRSKYRQFQTIKLTSPSRCHSLRKILVFSSPSHLVGHVRTLHVSGHPVDDFRWQVHDSCGLVFAAGAACSRMVNLRSLKLTRISLDLDQQATFILSLIEPFRLLSSISFDHCTLSACLLPHILSLCSNLQRLSFCFCHDSVINWMTPPAEMTVAADSSPKFEYIDCDDQAPTAALSLATKISFASPGAHLSLRICIRRTPPKDGFVSSMMVATKDILGELEIISDTTEPHRTEDENIPQCPYLEKLTLDLDSVVAYLPHFLPTPPPSSSLSSFSPPTSATTPDVDETSPGTTGSSRILDIAVRFQIHIQHDPDATASQTPKPLDLTLDTATQAKLLCLRDIVLQRAMKRLTLRPTIRLQTGTSNSSALGSGASSSAAKEGDDAEVRVKRVAIEREVSSVLGLDRGVCDVAFVWEE